MTNELRILKLEKQAMIQTWKIRNVYFYFSKNFNFQVKYKNMTVLCF